MLAATGFHYLARAKILKNGLCEDGTLVLRAVELSRHHGLLFRYDDTSMPWVTIDVALMPWLDCGRMLKEEELKK